MRHHYTTAALDLLKEGKDVDTVLAGVRRAMERRGHGHLYPKVVTDLLTAWTHFEEGLSPVITLAREQDETLLAETIAAQLKALDAPLAYKKIIKPEQIGGSIARYNHQVVDGSYKEALLRLYQRALHQST